jgi:sodium/potassium-transporting ATPase subunit alpha
MESDEIERNQSQEMEEEEEEIDEKVQQETTKLKGLSALLPPKAERASDTEQVDKEKIRNTAKEITESFHSNLKMEVKDTKSPRTLKEEKLKQTTSRFGKLKTMASFKKSVALEEVIVSRPLEGVPIEADVQKGPEQFKGVGLSTMTEHMLPFEKLCEKLQIKVDPRKPQESFGLSSAQVKERQDIYGDNKSKEKKESLYVLVIECMTNLFNVLLYASGMMYLIIYSIQPESNFESVWIGSTLISVGLINSGIEFYELYKIRSILKSFQKMIVSRSIVFRDGSRSEVESVGLVPGDVIYLRSGDKVPADCIVFHTNEMRVDGSNLTGENEPFVRLPNLVGFHEDSDPFECSNVLFSTDIIVSGEGYAVVVQTGEYSIAGKIKRMVKGTEKAKPSVLSKEINSFIKTIGFLAIFTALIFFTWALARGRNFTYAATFGIGILIAWIPQGLPFTVTMMLGLSGRRMTEQNVLVKDLHGIETLGTITMLATDKTGTLTRNEMNASEVWINETFLSVRGDSPAELNAKPLKLDISGIAQLMHVCVTCSRYYIVM